MKNAKKNTIIIMLILALVLFFIMKDDFNNIMDVLRKANLWWLLIGMIFIILYWALKSLGLYILVRKHTKKLKFINVFHQGVITEFFNGVTPFSTGGQPMQVYMLNKKGISGANATNMIVQSFLFFQTALIIHGILAVTLNYKFDILNVNSGLWTLVMLGFLINTIVGIGLLFISFSTKFNNFVGKKIIKIGHKLKIVKNQEETLIKWSGKLAEYHNNAEELRKDKLLFIKGFTSNFFALACLYIIPLFVALSMGLENINILNAMVASALVLLIGNFVPIPGGSGGIEFGFLKFFGQFLLGPILAASLIMWRFITYYFGIIVGGIALSFFKGDEKK